MSQVLYDNRRQSSLLSSAKSHSSLQNWYHYSQPHVRQPQMVVGPPSGPPPLSHTERRKVEGMIKKSNRLLLTIKASAPFSLFENYIQVTETRIIIKLQQSFFSTEHYTIDINDISNIITNSAMFYSTLILVSRNFAQNEIRVDWIKNSEAKQLHEVIEGLRSLDYANINTGVFEASELLYKLQNLHHPAIA